MIREEKIKRLKALKARCERLIVSSDRGPEEWRKDAEALDLALSALRPVSREKLSEFKTCDLVSELRKRDGVETHIAKPYQDVTVSVNGPAIVLVVID